MLNRLKKVFKNSKNTFICKLIGKFMMKIAKKVAVAAVVMLMSVVADGQIPPSPVATNVHGSILDAADLQPIPNVNIYVRHGYGTASNTNGYFELPCHLGDTIIFSCVGYQKVTFAVSDSLIGRSRVVGIVMSPDTVLLGEVVVLPFITYEQLKYEVAHMQSDANISLAISNVDLAVKSALTMPSTTTLDDGPMQQLASYTRRLENAGMYDPSKTINLVGFGTGLIAYLRMLKKMKEQQSVTYKHQSGTYNYNKAAWQLQMAKDVRKFVLDKKESSKDGDE